MVDARILQSLPRPTAEQFRAFAKLLPRAHSWYKHLSLRYGAQFVVFVAPDAGTGCKVAQIDGGQGELVTSPEGDHYTEQHPRLHYSWKTTSEYRRRFGYLDFAWRYTGAKDYERDVGTPISLPADLEERCRFVFYPYGSGPNNFITSSRHQGDLKRIRDGAEHSARAEVLEWARVAEAHDAKWQSLTDAERELVLMQSVSRKLIGSLPQDIQTFLELDRRVRVVFRRLYEMEAAKIHQALRALERWLSQE